MSFVRPELARAAMRWAETAVYGCATALILFWLSGAAVNGLWRVGLMIVVAAAGFWLTRAAYLSARAAADRPA